MWWECSECGGHVEHARAPTRCTECGTAGVIFGKVDPHDVFTGGDDADGLRAAWLRAGLERASLETVPAP